MSFRGPSTLVSRDDQSVTEEEFEPVDFPEVRSEGCSAKCPFDTDVAGAVWCQRRRRVRRGM